MRRIAAQLLRDHGIAAPRLAALRLPAPDVPPELVRGGCQRLLDCAAAAACSTSAGDVSQRRGMRLAVADQRLSPSQIPCETPHSATEVLCGRLNGLQRLACSPMLQHQQQRSMRLFEVPWRHARSTGSCMVALCMVAYTLYMTTSFSSPMQCVCVSACRMI